MLLCGSKIERKPLLMTSQAQTAPSSGLKDDFSLVESSAWLVHVCTFPMFELSDGRTCKMSNVTGKRKTLPKG